MKTAKFILACVLGIALAHSFSYGAGGPVTRRGADVLHLLVRGPISPTDLGPNTVGAMRLQYNEQGRQPVVRQTVDLTIAGLETNAVAGLTASIGEDTNVLTVASLNTDGRGRVRVSYVARSPVPPRLGRAKQPLPELLDPLTNVRAICVEDTALQVVGFAWVADAPLYQYIVKRNLTQVNPEGTADGSINLVANQRRVNFRLLAGGLNPGSEYSLALNSTVVGTFAANDSGRLLIRGWPSEAPPVLLLRSLELRDPEGTPVLSTTFPK